MEGLGRARRRHDAGILSRDHVAQLAADRIVCAVLQSDERSALGHEQSLGSQDPRVWDHSTYRNHGVPNLRAASTTEGPAVEQVNPFSKDALREDSRGGNELETDHFGRLGDENEVSRGEVVLEVGADE